jgi:hypothetical protein
VLMVFFRDGCLYFGAYSFAHTNPSYFSDYRSYCDFTVSSDYNTSNSVHFDSIPTMPVIRH